MGLIITLIAISMLLALAYTVAPEILAHFKGKCWRCHGTGEIKVRGERIPLNELDDRHYAEYLIEGTHFYRAVKETCPRCNGTGLK